MGRWKDGKMERFFQTMLSKHVAFETQLHGMQEVSFLDLLVADEMLLYPLVLRRLETLKDS